MSVVDDLGAEEEVAGVPVEGDGNRVVGGASAPTWTVEGVKLQPGLRVLFAVGIRGDGSRAASRPALAIVK